MIAYDDLYNMVIKNGFCTLCGACEAACPTNAIRIEEDVPSRIYDCSKSLDICPICYNVCPHTESLLTEAHAYLRDAPKINSNLGYFRKILLAQATDRNLLNLKGHGGAIIPSLLKYALDNQIIDSAVASELSSPTKAKLRPGISLVPDDILSAVESELYPSAVAEAFGRAVYEYGKTKVAFVGLPCHVLAMRKLEVWQHKIVDSLKLTMGLFCLWTFSLPVLMKYVFEEYGVETSEIQRLDLTNQLEIMAADKTLALSLDEVSAHILNRCKTCSDFSAELADISVGGAGSLRDWSMVIIRTKRGDDFFSEAVNAGVVHTLGLTEHPDVFVHVTEMSLRKKNVASKNIDTWKREKKPLPLTVDQPWSALPSEFLVLASKRIGDVMTKDVLTVPLDLSANQLLDLMTKSHHLGYPVVNEEGELCGIATFEDLRTVPKMDRDRILVKDIMKKDVIVDFMDEPVFKAFERMNTYDIGRIVIVDRSNVKKINGIITRSDIMHALRSVVE